MRNTMGKGEFIKEYIIWTLLLMIWFAKIVFRCIPGYTVIQTWIVFCGIFLLVSGLCIAVSINTNRNYSSLIQNLICAYGAFVVVAYWEFFAKRIVVAVSIAAAISLVGIYGMMSRKISRPENRKSIMRSRCYRSAQYLRKNLSLALLLVMAPIVARLVYTGTFLNAEPDVAVPVYGDEYSMASNMDVLVNLQEDRFVQLSIEEKLELAKVICHIEARYLGLGTEINVAAADLPEHVLGYYQDNTHTVCIGIEQLKTATGRELVEICTHEMYHSYQHRLVDSYYQVDENARNLLIYREIAVYVEEFADYKDGQEDSVEAYIEYYTQDMEADAREYSEWSVEDYFDRIETYLQENPTL